MALNHTIVHVDLANAHLICVLLLMHSELLTISYLPQ